MRRATLIAALAAAAWASGVGAAGGAGAGEVEIQRSSEQIEPDPSIARGDRGRPDGCPSRTQLGAKLRCIYGDRDGELTIVAFGDSTVMQYFQALDAIASRRGWRLVGLTRAGCPPMTVKYAYRCDRWRTRNLRRLARIDPEVVVTSSSIAYQVIAKGRRLSRKKSGPILRRAYVRTLRELKEAGARVVTVVNPPRAPSDPLECVVENRGALDRCAFERGRAPYFTYVARAAREARVDRIDANQIACGGGTCPAVIDDVLVRRDRIHLTATFTHTIVDWLGSQLKLRAPPPSGDARR